MKNGTKFVYLDGHVGFGDWHHQIMDQLADRAKLPDIEAKALSNYSLVNALPPVEGHDVAWGHLHNHIPVFWRTNADRNAISDTVRSGVEAATDAQNAVPSDSLDSSDYNQNGGNVSVGKTGANGGTAFNYVMKQMGGTPVADTRTLPGAGGEAPSFQLPDGTTVELKMQLQQGKMWLVYINVNPQRQGVGTQVMNLLKQYSDQTGLPMQLIPADAAKPFYDKFDWLDNPHHYNYNYVPGGRRASVFGNLAPWYIAEGHVIVGDYGQTAEEIGWEEGLTRGTVDIEGRLTAHIGTTTFFERRVPRQAVVAAIKRRYEGMPVSFPKAAVSPSKATAWWVEGRPSGSLPGA